MEFKTLGEVPDGYVLNNLFYARMIKDNRNVLAATVGKTGSGKSWFNLAVMESWYERKFNFPFPIQNVCFSVDDVVRRLRRDDLKRGEFLILEEGGVNMGSLDFQTKIAKTFNYILQSFRSLNLGLMINLPYFSMLNKNTRMLMHLLFETVSIDRVTNRIMVKPFILQADQRSGKVYTHAPKVLVNGSYEKLERETYPRPSQALVEAYEARKKAFVMRTIDDASEAHQKKILFTESQAQAYYLKKVKRLKNAEVGRWMGIDARTAANLCYTAEMKGITREILSDYTHVTKEFEHVPVKEIPTPPRT